MLLSAPRLALAVLTAAGAVSAATIKATTDETCK
jgi:hypothetical protein